MTIVILHLCIRFRSSMGALCLNSFPSLPSLEIFLCLVSSAKYTLSGLQLKCTACFYNPTKVNQINKIFIQSGKKAEKLELNSQMTI
jgi:hypothetical protein